MSPLFFLFPASVFAGFVDSIVGGGGLILLPSLFGAFPDAVPATLVGTNKGAAVCGTAWAATRYARRMRVAWRAIAPAFVAAMAGAVAGAMVLTRVSPGLVRKMVPFVLLAVLFQTVRNKRLGRDETGREATAERPVAVVVLALGVGFYDGFFGPGAGSLFIFGLVFLGYDFLRASVTAKFLNTATNVVALVAFGCRGHVWWSVAVPLGLANVLGSVAGTWLTLRHGVRFVRMAFIVVVTAFICKTAIDAFGVRSSSGHGATAPVVSAS